MESLSSCSVDRQKIEPVTTHKMASHLMDMNVIFQENMCLTDANHINTLKLRFFDHALTQERIETFFSSVQPYSTGSFNVDL